MQGFCSSVLAKLWAQYFFIVGHWPVHYRMFSSISRLDTLGSSCTAFSCDNKNVSDIAKCLLQGKITLVENQWCNMVH